MTFIKRKAVSCWIGWMVGQFKMFLLHAVDPVYLLNSIGPSLFDAVLGPHIVCVLCKFVHQQLLTWSQFYFGQVQRSRLITIRHHVATGKIMKKSFSVMEAIKGKSSGTSLPTFIALYKSLWQYVHTLGLHAFWFTVTSLLQSDNWKLPADS